MDGCVVGMAAGGPCLCVAAVQRLPVRGGCAQAARALGAPRAIRTHHPSGLGGSCMSWVGGCVSWSGRGRHTGMMHASMCMAGALQRAMLCGMCARAPPRSLIP